MDDVISQLTVWVYQLSVLFRVISSEISFQENFIFKMFVEGRGDEEERKREGKRKRNQFLGK